MHICFIHIKTENFISNGIANFSGAVGQQRVGKDIIGDFLLHFHL
ncbi:hypothetical protein ACFP3I_00240 [Chryseobacterium arachidis]